MRGLLLVIVLLALSFAAGMVVSERYGTPVWLKSIGDSAFDLIDKKDETTSADQAIEKTVKTTPDRETETKGPIVGSSGINDGLRINQRGLEIIKESEGLRLEAYELGNQSYVGYGHQIQPGDPTSVTEAEAEALLREDVRTAEDGVRAALTRQATSNQFSAMVSLAYNIGVYRFANSSDVSRKFNSGDIQGAADAFRNHNTAGGEVIDHLVQRREKERALFLSN